MRPTGSEMVAGIRRVLTEVVRPDLGSSYARDQLDHILLTLAQFDLDQVHSGLLEENHDLVMLLEACRAEADDDELGVELGRAVDALAVDRAGVLTLADVELAGIDQRNRTGRAALEHVIRSVALWTGDPGTIALRERIWNHVRRYPGGGFWRPPPPRAVTSAG